MDMPAVAIGLPVALAIIMFGLGLSLTVADFVRVGRYPKAALLALGCQILLVPLLCLGLVVLFDLEPVLAVGMMLLAASPGGTTANLFSHLARGDVALNVSLTAINSALSVVTIPIVVNLSVQHFMGSESGLELPPMEVLQVIAIVLVPVAIGMLVRAKFRAFAERMEGPVKIASAIVLAGVIAVAVSEAWEFFVENALLVGTVSLLLCVLSMAVGYWVPTLAGVGWRQSVASTMEVGVHNATLAIVIALELMDSAAIAVAPGIYGVLMFIPAAIAAYGFANSRRSRAVSVSGE